MLNNWGYSKLTRGDFAGAEKLFREALTYDADMFTAKNNLVLARGAQRKYDLPVVQMTQIERAQLLHTLALAAIKQGDVTMGKALLEDAIDTHPQHFDAAVRALRALESNVRAADGMTLLRPLGRALVPALRHPDRDLGGVDRHGAHEDPQQGGDGAGRGLCRGRA